jgi:polar amino acid transport system substrate-binding protein
VEIAEPVIVAFETEALGIEALADGDGIDAMIVGRLAAQDAIDIGKPVRVVGPPLFRQPLAIAVDKGDLAFAARIAAAVESLRADGTLARLSLEHLGVDAAPPAP